MIWREICRFERYFMNRMCFFRFISIFHHFWIVVMAENEEIRSDNRINRQKSELLLNEFFALKCEYKPKHLRKSPDSPPHSHSFTLSPSLSLYCTGALSLSLTHSFTLSLSHSFSFSFFLFTLSLSCIGALSTSLFSLVPVLSPLALSHTLFHSLLHSSTLSLSFSLPLYL